MMYMTFSTREEIRHIHHRYRYPLSGERRLGTLQAIIDQTVWLPRSGVYLIRDFNGAIRYIGYTQRSIFERVRRSHVFKLGMNVSWHVSVLPGTRDTETQLIRTFTPDFNTAHSISPRRRLEHKLAVAINEHYFWSRLPDLRR